MTPEESNELLCNSVRYGEYIMDMSIRENIRISVIKMGIERLFICKNGEVIFMEELK